MDSKYITHPNLAQYIDVVRGRASRLGVVCEHYELRLLDFLQHQHRGGLQQQRVWGCAAQLLSAVAMIHEQGLVHHSELLPPRPLPRWITHTHMLLRRAPFWC
jgi:serine/threonine protein kinase